MKNGCVVGLLVQEQNQKSESEYFVLFMPICLKRTTPYRDQNSWSQCIPIKQNLFCIHLTQTQCQWWQAVHNLQSKNYTSSRQPFSLSALVQKDPTLPVYSNPQLLIDCLYSSTQSKAFYLNIKEDSCTQQDINHQHDFQTEILIQKAKQIPGTC